MNELFLNRMKHMLGDEYDAYLQSLNQPAKRGIRINVLKREASAIEGICEERSPFCANGWYISPECPVGSLPEYFAGHIYPQEPSASFAVTAMDVRPGMKILDLCAAPGSKSTQIAECLNNEGLLVANEIHPGRAAILKENLERHGCANAVVVNSSPSQVAALFSEYFDAVLCDAPCSGEGMFRKDPDAILHWSYEHVASCAVRQAAILDDAAACLKPGGVLIYSTCTFSEEEDEDTVRSFLERHPEFHPDPIMHKGGRSVLNEISSADFARRIYPMDQGEGHFVARMRKQKDDSVPERPIKLLKSEPVPSECIRFLKEHGCDRFPYLYFHKNVLYGGTSPFIDVSPLHLIRHQTVLGTIKNNRFEPAHALALSSLAGMCPIAELNEEELQSYRHGDTIQRGIEKGWAAAAYKGMRIGLVKSDGRMLKNHYPKAFRVR